MKLLLATTNLAKIDRYKRYFSGLDPKIQIVTLNELDPQRLILEPIENGKDEVENAILKARYYQNELNFEGLVFAEDSGMILHGVDELDNPKKDIKKPVIKKFGYVNPENMAKYYSELANKYGGKIDQEWVFGYALVSNAKLTTKKHSNSSILVSEIKYPIDPGYPLNSVTRIIRDGQEAYLSLLNQQEWQLHWDDEVIEVLKDLVREIV